MTRLSGDDPLVALIIDRQNALISDVSEIKMLLAERKGERRVAMWVASTTSGALGAALAFVFKFMVGIVGASHS